MFHSISKRLLSFLVLSLALGLPLSLLAQGGTDLAPPPVTDMTSDAAIPGLGTDFTAGKRPDPAKPRDEQQKTNGEPSRPGTAFVLGALSLAGLALAIVSGFFLHRFVKAIETDKKLSAESHWGGFGGGLGGWQISSSLAYLLTALVFGSLFTLLMLKMADVVTPKQDDKPAATDNASSGGAETTEKKGGEDSP